MLGTGGGNRSQKPCGQISKLLSQSRTPRPHRPRSLPLGGHQWGLPPHVTPKQMRGWGGSQRGQCDCLVGTSIPAGIPSPCPGLLAPLGSLSPTPTPPSCWGPPGSLLFPDLSPHQPACPDTPSVLWVSTCGDAPSTLFPLGAPGLPCAQALAGSWEGCRFWAGLAQPGRLPSPPGHSRWRHREQIPAQAVGTAGGGRPHSLSLRG